MKIFALLVLGCLVASCASSGRSPELAASGSPWEPAAEPAASRSPASSAAAPQVVYGPRAKDWEVTLGGSGANDNDFDTGGFTLAGSGGYFFDERQEVGVRQSVSYSDFGDSIWNGSTRFFYDFHFGEKAFRPLIGANLGYVYGDSVDETLEAAPEAGIKWYATESAFLFALVEYQFFFEDTDEADDAFEDGSFVYTIGIGMRVP